MMCNLIELHISILLQIWKYFCQWYTDLLDECYCTLFQQYQIIVRVILHLYNISVTLSAGYIAMQVTEWITESFIWFDQKPRFIEDWIKCLYFLMSQRIIQWTELFKNVDSF